MTYKDAKIKAKCRMVLRFDTDELADIHDRVQDFRSLVTWTVTIKLLNAYSNEEVK